MSKNSGNTLHPIIFFDGVCLVCNKFVNFVMKRDQGYFLFAPLQGETARKILDQRFLELKTIVLYEKNTAYVKSQAVIKIASHLGWNWSLFQLFRLIPKKILNFFYDYFSRHRYRWFGKAQECKIPTKEILARFLD